MTPPGTAVPSTCCWRGEAPHVSLPPWLLQSSCLLLFGQSVTLALLRLGEG